MAKKNAHIEGFPGIDKLTVQKSRPLQALWQSDLSLAQFKILDTYLSRIDSRHPEKRLVRFEKGEIEKILGVNRIRKDELDKRLDGLYRGIRVDDPDLKCFRKVGLFELAECTRSSDGLWTIGLQCTASAMQYIFDIDHIGYLRYKLRSIVSLRSRYAYILFIYLESNRYRKSWEIGLEDLKKMLGALGTSYQQYFRFREKILDRAQKELHEKTELRFSYTPVKKGRTVTGIRFEVETLPELDPVDHPHQITVEQYMQSLDDGELWETAIEGLTFSREQLDELGATLRLIPAQKMPPDPATGTGSIEFSRYHYMEQKYMELRRRDAQKPIKHKFAYLLKMLRQDAQAE